MRFIVTFLTTLHYAREARRSEAARKVAPILVRGVTAK